MSEILLPSPLPLVHVEGLTKEFASGGRGARRTHKFHAVNDVSFEIHRGETLGLIGESGSGKSTIGRILLLLETPTAGKVSFDGVALSCLSTRREHELRKRVQIVFQDCGSAFNRRRSVRSQIADAGLRLGGLQDSDVQREVETVVERVGLSPSMLDRTIVEFSGGQRQRLGIARALIASPDFLVLDEPTAALDVSVQAQVLNLLKDLQAERNLTMLLITHHLALVEHMCERAAVLHAGRIAEIGLVDQLLSSPQSPVTQRLLDAVLEPAV